MKMSVKMIKSFSLKATTPKKQKKPLTPQALDAEGARRLVDDLCSFDVDLCTLIKDGDATSCGKASERKRELLAAMHPHKAKLFDTDITELSCCRHYGKNTTKLLQRNWKKTCVGCSQRQDVWALSRDHQQDHFFAQGRR